MEATGRLGRLMISEGPNRLGDWKLYLVQVRSVWDYGERLAESRGSFTWCRCVGQEVAERREGGAGGWCGGLMCVGFVEA